MEEGIIVGATLDHDADFGCDESIVPGFLHGLQIMHKIKGALAGSEEFQIGIVAALIFDMRVDGIGSQARHRHIDGDAHHLHVADVEIEAHIRVLDLLEQPVDSVRQV